MEGNAGDDDVTVRAFALTSGTDRYNIDAPVDIDGGAGLDKVVVLGTERDDNFVTTEQNVFGAGLSVGYDQTEKLELDGLEGDDDFFVRSTRQGVETTILGGLGSDTVNAAGDVTQTIVSQDLEYRTGVINHAVSAEGDTPGDPLYDGLVAATAATYSTRRWLARSRLSTSEAICAPAMSWLRNIA